MKHRIVLSNGRVLLIEEAKGTLHVATESEGFPNDVDAYICEITPSGVLVMPNSGEAPLYITEGLAQ